MTRQSVLSINKNKLEIFLSECRFHMIFTRVKIIEGFYIIYQSKYKITDKYQNVLEILDSKEDLKLLLV